MRRGRMLPFRVMARNTTVSERHSKVTPAEGLLDADDVAALLRTTPRQVRNMRSRGQLPPATKWPGLGVRWSAAKLHEWIAERAEQAGATC